MTERARESLPRRQMLVLRYERLRALARSPTALGSHTETSDVRLASRVGACAIPPYVCAHTVVAHRFLVTTSEPHQRRKESRPPYYGPVAAVASK